MPARIKKMGELSPDTWEAIARFDERVEARWTEHEQRRDTHIAAIALVVCKKRDEAVRARQADRIEDIWRQAEERYAGIDEANRGTKAGRRWEKSTTLNSPIYAESSRPQPGGERSTVYPRLTARYVDATFSKLCEMMLSPDDKSFSIEHTPMPDLVDLVNDQSQVSMDGQGLEVPAMTPPRVEQPVQANPGQELPPNGGQPSPASPTSSGGVGQAAPQATQPLTVGALVQEPLAAAKKGAKMAETRIYDWLVEAKHTAHARKVIFDSIRLGVGVMKGPYPKATTRRAVHRETGDDGNARIIIKTIEETKPTVCRVNPWNYFPDPACGDNPKNGDFVVERMFLSPKQVRALKDQPGYQTRMLNKILTMGPQPSAGNTQESANYAGAKSDKKQYECWYFYGTVTREEFGALNPSMADPSFSEDEGQDEMHIIVTIINDMVVYATPNPSESGEFPYHTIPYIYKEGSWVGEGLPERLEVPERILVGATRAMMNNAGVSSGSQFIIEQSGLVPANGSYTITPDKIWYRTDNAIAEDVRKLFMAIDIPNKTPQLYQVIEYAFRLAEESSNLPLITQGFAGKDNPENLGLAQMQNTNASQMLREIAHNFDECITEPLIHMLYEWLLLDPDIPVEEKGDWTIHAQGSTALVERALQDEFLLHIMQMVGPNPQAFGADLKKMFVQILKSKRLDPRDFKMSEEEAKAASQGKAPQVEVAQIREQGSMEREKMKLQAAMQQQEGDVQMAMELAKIDMALESEKLKMAYMQHKEEQLNVVRELELKREIFIARYANDRGINLENAKTQLATTAMKVRLQRELSAQKLAGGEGQSQVLTPPTEPAERAPDGEAFVA